MNVTPSNRTYMFMYFVCAHHDYFEPIPIVGAPPIRCLLGIKMGGQLPASGSIFEFSEEPLLRCARYWTRELIILFD